MSLCICVKAKGRISLQTPGSRQSHFHARNVHSAHRSSQQAATQKALLSEIARVGSFGDWQIFYWGCSTLGNDKPELWDKYISARWCCPAASELFSDAGMWRPLEDPHLQKIPHVESLRLRTHLNATQAISNCQNVPNGFIVLWVRDGHNSSKHVHTVHTHTQCAHACCCCVFLVWQWDKKDERNLSRTDGELTIHSNSM